MNPMTQKLWRHGCCQNYQNVHSRQPRPRSSSSFSLSAHLRCWRSGLSSQRPKGERPAQWYVLLKKLPHASENSGGISRFPSELIFRLKEKVNGGLKQYLRLSSDLTFSVYAQSPPLRQSRRKIKGISPANSHIFLKRDRALSSSSDRHSLSPVARFSRRCVVRTCRQPLSISLPSSQPGPPPLKNWM